VRLQESTARDPAATAAATAWTAAVSATAAARITLPSTWEQANAHGVDAN